VSELSGLAWEEDEQRLYAVSDDGILAQFRPAFRSGLLTGLDLQAAHPLKNADGRPFRGAAIDSEGLDVLNGEDGVKGNTEVLVTFEQTPRLVGFHPDGKFRREYPLPAPLRDIAAYQDENAALEAVSAHPGLGILVAPAKPLKAVKPDGLSVYSLDGRNWRYSPLDAEDSALMGFATGANGGLVLLERKYESMFKPVVFALRAVRLDAPGGSGVVAAAEELAHFSTQDDWKLDNFEGITRHRGNRFFLVSDDNRSVIQKTLLLYLEVLPDARKTARGN
jgi:hypothetical protein